MHISLLTLSSELTEHNFNDISLLFSELKDKKVYFIKTLHYSSKGR